MLKEMVAVVAIGMDAVVVEDQVAEAVLVVVAVADQAEAVVLVVEAGQAEVVTEAEVVVLVVGTEKVVLEAVSAAEIPSLLTREGTTAPSRDKNCSNKA